MFNLKGNSNNKKKKPTDYTFDLENDLKDPGKSRAIKEQVSERVQQLKGMLRQGEDKKAFDQTQTLLHGYLAIQKVLQRANRKMF